MERILSHDVASGSDIAYCNKIDKPLVVYRFCNVITPILMCVEDEKSIAFSPPKCVFRVQSTLFKTTRFVPSYL